MRVFLVAVFLCGVVATRSNADPTLSSWIQNTTGATGHSTNTTVNNAIHTIQSNVQQVRYTTTDVYINATDIPSYDIGPWPGNPNIASNQNQLNRLPRSPSLAASNNTTTGLGAIGIWVNGVQIFNGRDGNSYNNQNVWHSNAVIVEAASFDAALGHPQQAGAYHHHEHPISLQGELDDDGTDVSPILGYAFDGFPIYGPYMYANANGTGGVKRMVSSYQMRSITQRNTQVRVTPAGTTNTVNVSAGPVVSTQFPLGYYVEDFQYLAGSGDLNQFNMRFTVTPEYPSGTWAYFTTIDASGAAAYPYIVGEFYGGTVATDNLNHSVSVPGNALIYSAPEPSSVIIFALGCVGLLFYRRRMRNLRAA